MIELDKVCLLFFEIIDFGKFGTWVRVGRMWE